MLTDYDIIIDNVSSHHHGITVVNRVDIPPAQKNVQFIDVLGRDGSLTKDYGYLDRVFTVDFNFKIKSRWDNMPKKIRTITSWLLNANELAFTDDREVFYRVKSVRIGNISREIRVLGKFSVEFTVEPFAYYYDSNKITLTKPRLLYNQGTIESLPYVKIYGDGDITLTVNGVNTQFKSVDEYIECDSDIKETYKEGKLLNNAKVGAFPIFDIGQNDISWSGNVKSIEILPRWRFI